MFIRPQQAEIERPDCRKKEKRKIVANVIAKSLALLLRCMGLDHALFVLIPVFLGFFPPSFPAPQVLGISLCTSQFCSLR